jgi:hypothetical protein
MFTSVVNWGKKLCTLKGENQKTQSQAEKRVEV